MADPLVQETQELYGLPQSEFTAARSARVKELKRDDADLAARVAALPKPSVAAAALNELAREEPSEFRALVQSGKRLRSAQEAAVSGKRGANLNAAVQEHRTSLDRVQRDLKQRKLSGPTLEKATQTLRVASIDPELWPLLERGVLHEDLTASGFGLDPGLVQARPRQRAAPKGKPKPDRKADERRRREAREQLRAAEGNLAEAQRNVERAAAEVERARKRAEEA